MIILKKAKGKKSIDKEKRREQKENMKPIKRKIQPLVDYELYLKFKEVIKPLKPGGAINSYMRVCVNSKTLSLNEVIDDALESFIKKK